MRPTCFLLCRPHRVAVVGGGPSGFYTAQTVLKGLPECEVDVFDALPVPFGLARYGVAPDHPEVKNVGKTFTSLFTAPDTQHRIRFWGNTVVGDLSGVTVEKLLRHYHQVVVGTGAGSDRKLGIPGEDEHVRSARELVAWYNGYPASTFPQDWSTVKHVAIIGNGNVAVDCARMLLAPPEHLQQTDITTEAFQTLVGTNIASVSLVARRGVLNSAFTIKEFREMLNLGRPQGVSPNPWLATEVYDAGMEGDPEALDKRYRRLVQLVLKTAEEGDRAAPGRRAFAVRYLRKPVAATRDGLEVAVMRVSGPEAEGKVEDTGVREVIAADLILRSIGYRAVPFDSTLPFNEASGTIAADLSGRVQGCPRTYCCGWAKNGPVGTILTAHVDGKQVGAAVVADAPKFKGDTSCDGKGAEAVLGSFPLYTDWATWERIREFEAKRGEELGKLAEKVCTVDEMLAFRTA